MKKITCFILTLLIIVGVSPFAFATHIKVYDKNFERMIPELRSTLKWEKSKEKSTEWMGKDHQVHWRDGGYEQEYYDEFYSDQLDYLLSYPFEEYVEMSQRNPNVTFDENMYDGINFKDPSGQRMFLFIQLNSDRMYDDFVVTLKDCGMTGNMGFYIEFYPQYFGGPGAEDDGYWGNPGGYYGGPPAQHNIHGGNGSYIVSISDLIQAIKESWKKITGEELGDAQVAMIICDLFFECGSGDGYDLHAVGDAGHAFGLCQWNDCFAHRTIDMINYCEENYPDIPWQDNLKGQVEFMVLEMIPGNQYSDSIWIEYGYNEFMNLDEDHIGRGVFLLASYFERCAEENRSGRQWAGDNAQGAGYLKDVKDVNQELAQQNNNNNNNNNNNGKPNSNTSQQNSNNNNHNNNNNSSNNKPSSSNSSYRNQQQAAGHACAQSLRVNNVNKTRYDHSWGSRNNDSSECVGDAYLPVANMGLDFSKNFSIEAGIGTKNFFVNGEANAYGMHWYDFFEQVPWDERQEGDLFLTYNGGHMNCVGSNEDGFETEISFSSSAGMCVERGIDWVYQKADYYDYDGTPYYITSSGEAMLAPDGPTGNVAYRWKPEYAAQIAEAAAAQELI